MSSGFVSLVGELNNSIKTINDTLDPSSTAMVALTTRCIIRQGTRYLEHLKTHAKGPAKVAVMCALLADKTQDDDGVNEALQINAASTLLSDSSPLAMRRMRELPHLFVRIPHESTVPKVTSLIRDNIGNTDETTNDIVGTAAAVLTAIMQNCKANLESLVQLVVKELVQIESSTRSADLVGEVCGRFGGDRCLKTPVCR